MIIKAEQKHYSQIRALWDTAFGEDKDFNDYFFENMFCLEHTLVYIVDDRVVAMTQAMPYEIKDIGCVSYIYGAATHPDFRKRGIMSQLLNHSFTLDMKNGFSGSMLIPAERSLFDYYARFGYRTAFYVEETEISANDFTDFRHATAADIPKLNAIYEGALKGIPHPIRTDREWLRQTDMFKALGGYVYICDSGYAFGFNGNEPAIQELIDNGGALSGGIAARLGLKKIKCTTPVKNAENKKTLGMLKLYNNTEADMYFNLMMN